MERCLRVAGQSVLDDCLTTRLPYVGVILHRNRGVIVGRPITTSRADRFQSIWRIDLRQDFHLERERRDETRRVCVLPNGVDHGRFRRERRRRVGLGVGHDRLWLTRCWVVRRASTNRPQHTVKQRMVWGSFTDLLRLFFDLRRNCKPHLPRR